MAAADDGDKPDGELESTSLVSLAVSALRNEILSGALEPGERIVEEQLTRRFGTSRAPIREALRLLGEQGLVDHLPRRGVRVTRLSEQDFDELFAVRDALEQFAVELMIEQSTGSPDVSPLAATLQQMSVAAEVDDRLAASQAHRAFHLALVGLAGSRQLLATYEPVILKLQLYMAANLRREADLLAPIEGALRHRRLLEVIASGDPDAARAALKHHGARSFFH